MDPIDYEKVIADLEQRRTSFNFSIDSAISAIKAVVSAGTSAAPVTITTDGRGMSMSSSLAPGMLFGKSIPEAAITALTVYKRPMAAKEIGEALEAASYHHRSKNFTNTVNSILNRRTGTVGDVVRIGKTWALAEWYPGRRRQRLESSFDEIPKAAQADDSSDE